MGFLGSGNKAELARSHDNIDESDERDFKELAKIVLAFSDAELKTLVDSGKYVEVTSDDPSEELQK